MIQTIEDCLRERVLRKISPDTEKTKKSMSIAKDRLQRAEQLLSTSFFDYVILSAYMSMFHAARAVLYRDGIQEKSHYAIFIYLKEKYGKQVSSAILNLLNIHRTQRHEAMYGVEFTPSKEDAQSAVEDAQLFFETMKKLLIMY